MHPRMLEFRYYRFGGDRNYSRAPPRIVASPALASASDTFTRAAQLSREDAASRAKPHGSEGFTP